MNRGGTGRGALGKKEGKGWVEGKKWEDSGGPQGACRRIMPGLLEEWYTRGADKRNQPEKTRERN